MSKAELLADRLSLVSLRLVAAANLIFLLSFLLVVVLAAGEARAETAVCTGNDLLAELGASDPAALERIRAEAAATPNGSGLLWKLEKDGVAPSYLFGTMHLTDPRVTTLTPQAQAAFDGANTVVIETTDVLDQSAILAAMASRPDLMAFTDGTTLSSLMSPEQVKQLDAALEKRSIPPASVQTMKPWILAAAVSLPSCELVRKASGLPFLDIKLAQDAKAQGKALGGLETMIGQMEAMASLPMSFHLEGLLSTLELGTKLDDLFETMVELYVKGDTGMVWPLFRAALPEGDEGSYAAFEETMISTRNRTMAENSAAFLDKGGAFIAVGALHLPGKDGLVELLKSAGYRVSPAG